LDPAVVRRLEQVVVQLKRSGELDRIYQRYQKDH
jgi:ABC-type amino acid transport substrate-binding protein